MYNKVELCGMNTAKLPVLTEAEKRELLARAHAGDAAAREQMVEGNLRLVLSVVQRFAQRGENLDDLFQVGCIGLIKAIDNFDPAQPVRFSTYGVPMIIGEMKRAIRDRTTIKVSRSMRDVAYRALKAREELSKLNANDPSMLEIAKEIDVPIGEVACALDAVSEPLSFYEPVFSDSEESVELIDQLADKKENSDNWTEKIALYEAFKHVPDRELQVVKLRYFDGKTQVEISKIVGISQAQVSRLEKSALEKIRECMA